MRQTEQDLLLAELRLEGVRELHTGRYDDGGVLRCRSCRAESWPCLTRLFVDAPFSEVVDALESPPPAP